MDFRGRNIDLVGKLPLWFGISIAVLVIGMVAWRAFGLNYGIDFKSGSLLQYRIPQGKRPAPGEEASFLANARGLLEKRGLQQVRLQITGGDTLLIVSDAADSAAQRSQERIIGEALRSQLADAGAAKDKPIEPLRRELVGPAIGKELRNNAIKGVLLGVLMIAGWIFIRYNFAGEGLRYAAGGITALVHDVLVLIGLFAIIGRFFPRVEIDGSFIAALLTVVGYSINDSVVIFDRIRENLRKRRKEPYNKVVNDSLLETMSRSINTGLTVLIMLFVLLIFGGESIYNFVLAMLLGIASGLYSSIFNASMVLVAWHNYDEKKAAAARAARPSRRVGTTSPARELPTRRVSTVPDAAAATTGAAPSTASTPDETLGRNGAINGTVQEDTVPPSGDGATSSPATPARTAPSSSARKARSRRRF